jgi:hypothetical protein
MKQAVLLTKQHMTNYDGGYGRRVGGKEEEEDALN